MSTCAFVPCAEAASCALVGGCVARRFAHVPRYEPRSAREADGIKETAPALNGVKPARTNRDPARIKRKRKALTP